VAEARPGARGSPALASLSSRVITAAQSRLLSFSLTHMAVRWIRKHQKARDEME
jgi:hypothetical protein